MSFINVEVKKIAFSGKKADKSLSAAIASRMMLHVEETFDKEGPGWKPLSSRTKKQRLAQGFGEGPILDRKRFTENRGLRYNIHPNYDETKVVVGVDPKIKYARIHQFGGRITRVTQPGMVRLRTNRKGELLRQSKYPNLAVFGKTKHKLVKESAKSFGKRYSIYIPRRKYLFFTDKLMDDIKKLAIEFLRK